MIASPDLLPTLQPYVPYYTCAWLCCMNVTCRLPRHKAADNQRSPAATTAVHMRGYSPSEQLPLATATAAAHAAGTAMGWSSSSLYGDPCNHQRCRRLSPPAPPAQAAAPAAGKAANQAGSKAVYSRRPVEARWQAAMAEAARCQASTAVAPTTNSCQARPS